MRGELEKLLRSAGVPNPERAEHLWQEYRAASPRAESAFATLLAWYGHALYRRIWGFVRSSDAEDVFQEVLSQLHRHRLDPRLARFADVLPWLRTVADNACRDRKRRVERREKREASRAVAEGRCDLAAERSETQELLAAALAKLSPQCRAAISLVFFEGMSRQAAAAELNIHRDTLATRLQEALERLRSLLPVPTVLALGGLAGMESMLGASPPSVRLAALANRGVKAGATGKAMLAASMIGLMLGGAAVAALLANPDRDEAPNPASRTTLPASSRDTLQERNLRLFHGEVEPKLLAALQSFAFGEGGRAEVREVRAYWTRIECVAIVRHGKASGVESKLKIIHETVGVTTRYLFDLVGNGEWRPLNTDQPIYWNNPFNGERTVLKLSGLDAVTAAFAQPVWDDPRQESEWAGFRKELQESATGFSGTWFESGDSARPVTVIVDSNNEVLIDSRLVDGTRYVLAVRMESKVGENGKLIGAGDGARRGIALSPDGKRLDFADGRYWTREPIKK